MAFMLHWGSASQPFGISIGSVTAVWDGLRAAQTAHLVRRRDIRARREQRPHAVRVASPRGDHQRRVPALGVASVHVRAGAQQPHQAPLVVALGGAEERR